MATTTLSRRYRLTRGAYYGTTDDRADRWYIEDTESVVIDRRGPGFACRRCAQYECDNVSLLAAKKCPRHG